MRSIATCYNDHAIRVSDSYCSGPSTGHSSFPSPALSPSAPIEITTIYRADLSSPQNHLLLTLEWRNSFLGQGMIIGVVSSGSDVTTTNPRRLQKIKGTKQFNTCNLKIEVFWDLTAARFDNGPEPSSGFYVIVMAESEVILILGDRETEQNQCLGPPRPKFAIISRTEHFVGGTSYATKVRFIESGKTHDIAIRCSRAEEGTGTGSCLSVFVDRKRVCEVRRLRWNFRGNQTLFVDGLLVDMMWDVHDWFFWPRVGCAVFMLRRRSGLESRLWLEEKKEIEKVEFSLLICAINDS